MEISTSNTNTVVSLLLCRCFNFATGQYLCGALCDGKLFLWDRDNDKVQFITGLPKVFNDADKGNSCFFL